MTATADQLLSVHGDLTETAHSIHRLADGIHHDIPLFVAVTSNTNTINPHILHGLQADLDRIEREARILRAILTELEGE